MKILKTNFPHVVSQKKKVSLKFHFEGPRAEVI